MKVIVCGAGIAGLALALCLERRGHSVFLIERSARLRDDGYMIDFFGSGVDAMERLGLLPELHAIHEPVDRIAILDVHGHEQVSLSYSVLRKRLFSDRHFNFMRGKLERLLSRYLIVPPVRFDTTVESYQDDDNQIIVRLSDGSTHAADVLVGADGVHSRVRRLMFGDDGFVQRLGYQAAAYVINRPPPSLDVGKNLITITAPHRQVTLYPTRDGGLATFFLHETCPEDSEPGRTAPCTVLRTRYGDFTWILPIVLEHCEESSSLYIDEVEQVRLPRWSDGRVVLVGDACYCVSPLAGQGASMAVAGAYVLAELVSDNRDLAAAFFLYEKTLRPTIERQQAAARRIGRWFVPSSELRLWMRNLVTRASVLPPVAAVVRQRMATASMFRS